MKPVQRPLIAGYVAKCHFAGWVEVELNRQTKSPVPTDLNRVLQHSKHHIVRIKPRGSPIRTSVNIPSDALELARQRAKECDLTLGEAIGELVRKGAEEERTPSDFWKEVKFLPNRPGKPKITSELVYQLLDEEY